jgi:DNA repair protein RecN (Recombination protein N)
MLSELRIQNFAIIDKLELKFATGFNAITGETGAGKSIIIDAVDLLLGGRADVDAIRAGEDRAIVEGSFKMAPTLVADLQPLFSAEEIDFDPHSGEITLSREIRANGRSISRLNGSTVSLQFYREIGGRLVDVHGQTEHLSLLRPKSHIGLLDNFAGLEGQVRTLAALVAELLETRRQRDELLQDEAALARRIDSLNYQIEEIEAVDPKIGEETSLGEESARLGNAEQLAALSGEAAQILDNEDPEVSSVSLLLSQVAAALAKVQRIDAQMADAANLAQALSEQANDLAITVRDYYDGLEQNPARLAEVEERLDAISRLKKKYGGSIEAVLAYAAKAKAELDTITNSEAQIARLQAQEETLLRRIGVGAAAISAARAKAAQNLATGIENELGDLKMEGARFQVSLEQAEDEQGCYVGEKRLAFDQTGIDRVEFMMAANRGEPLRPVAKVASGGETARIMLALKGVLSRADKTPTLIFDEVDQGIGGRLGSMLGQKLWRLSTDHQVLCVTHLAQLASFADSHFKVSKAARGDRTVTSVRPLDDKLRVEELAEMLGAETVSAKQSAHDLLMLARQVKAGRSIQAELL